MERRIVAVGPEEAAQRLDKNITTIYRWLHSKSIAALKEGREWKIFLVEIKQDNSPTLYLTMPYESLPSVIGEDVASIIGG